MIVSTRPLVFTGFGLPLLGLCLCLLLSACGSGAGLSRSSSDWNDAGVWKRLPDEPGLAGGLGRYVPRDWPDSAPRPPAVGNWVLDRDGSRFFVPRQGTRAYPIGILNGEVKKATDHRLWSRRRSVKLPQSPYPDVSLRGPHAEADEAEAVVRRAKADREARQDEADRRYDEAAADAAREARR